MSAGTQQQRDGTGQVFALIPKIMAKVGAVSKDRKNAQQGYSFRGIDDIYAAMQGPLSEHGLFYVPEVLSKEVTERTSAKGAALIYTTLTVAYTFYASDGSSVRAVVVGEAMDSGDKSSNKAMSAALKYALLQIFCIPTETQDDPDYDSHEVNRRPEPYRQQPPATKPAPVATSTIATELQVRQIDEYESSLEGFDVTRKFLHDKLEEKYKTREPARLTASEASDYLEWLKAMLAKKRGV